MSIVAFQFIQEMNIWRSPVHGVVVAIVSCLSLSAQAAPDVSSTSLPGGVLQEDPTLDLPHHLAMTPEATELLKTLVRLDRNVLKTIDENHNTLLMTFVPSMVLESYNFSAGTADCGTAQNRALSPNILKRKEIIDKKIDEALDKMIHKWDALKSQADLEAYFVQFWEDRNAIYKYVSHKGEYKPCRDDIESESCPALGAMEKFFGEVFSSLSDCKVKFWKD